jgi:hypothetical protein
MSDKRAEDWVTLWQSELTAMAGDRELRESWAAMVALWAGTATGALALLRAPPDVPPGTAGTRQPAGPPPALAAPDPGLDEVAGLHRRIAELERRLAAFERNGEPAA